MNKILMTLALVLGFVTTSTADVKDMTAVCAACHGADGNSAAATFPKLAGQNAKYLLKQLNDIQSGARPIPTMIGQLDNMSADDLAAIADFYASQAPTGGQADPDKVELGQKIYRAGNSKTGVAACAACHGARGDGNGPAGFPSLAGQHADYIASSLRAFRIGSENTLEENPAGRTNDGDGRMMRDVAARMSDNEIDAVASYIAGLY